MVAHPRFAGASSALFLRYASGARGRAVALAAFMRPTQSPTVTLS